MAAFCARRTLGQFLASNCSSGVSRCPVAYFTRSFYVQQNDSEPPKRPTRPLSAFFRFLAEKRDAVKKANPELNDKDAACQVGVMWNNLPEEVKERYTMESIREREEFKKVMDDWWASLTPFQQNQYLQSEVGAKSKRAKRVLAKQDFISLAKLWKTMSEEERKPYNTLAKKNFDIYTKDKLVWELKMMREGHGELIFRKEGKLVAATLDDVPDKRPKSTRKKDNSPNK